MRQHWRQAGRAVTVTSLLDLPDKDQAVFLDLAQPPETWPLLPTCRAAVFCAAITSLEKCRQEPAATRLVNVTRSLLLAQRLAEAGAFLVFISSNLVFDGAKPWRGAAEAPCPVTEYGRQKAEAEAGLRQWGSQAAIVRLTKVFHPDLPVVRQWTAALEQGQVIKPFSDLLCSPITLLATVRAIVQVAESRQGGIWQLSGARDISYAKIARYVAAHRGFHQDRIQPVSARSTSQIDYLPTYTTLDATRAQNELGFLVLEHESVLDEVFYERPSA